MYEIRPESIKTFIEDKSIKLPRFQRKQTWDIKKCFALCISIFKGYPLGVVVINKEVNKNKKNIKWLLDGRQRRNALINLYNDPEVIYDSARAFLGFKAGDQPEEIANKFWSVIEKYIGEDNDDCEEEVEEDNDYLRDSQEDNDYDDEEVAEIAEGSDLDSLLDIIISIHKKNNNSSQFTRPFDFGKNIEKIEYMDIVNGNRVLSAKKLKSWMRQYQTWCNDNDYDYFELDQETFINFLFNRYTLTEEAQKEIKKHVDKYWYKMKKRFEICDLIDNKMQETKIGIIEISSLDTNDSQKIFEIINTAGTPLTAAEILSAKPSWNIPVKENSEELKSCIKRLYKEMGITPEDIVRWDIPATLLDRLPKENFIFKDLNYNVKSDFEKKTTLGFKLMSAVFQGGITKNHISELADNPKIDWLITPQTFLRDLTTIIKLLSENTFYKFFASWRKPIMELTSDALVINYIVLCYMDWKRKGEPIGNSTDVKKFINNSKILLDTLMYSYINKQFRGSSDSRIAESIKKMKSEKELFTPIDNLKWENLINEIIDNHSVNGKSLNQNNIDKVMRTILIYYYTLAQIEGPGNVGVKIDVDHIYARTYIDKFSTIENKDLKIHNLFNLCILPKKENISKRDNRLDEVTDQWLISQIEKYAEIPRDDFKKYSLIENFDELKQYRKDKFIKVFTKDRISRLQE